MELRNNLLGTAAVAAAFLGIGRGVQPAAPAPCARVEPSLPRPAGKKSSAEDGLDDDDDAMDDDDDGKDAPDDEDDADMAAEKRARRRARKAKRIKAEEDAKKAKSEGDDDSDTEMRGTSAAALARLRERARCAAIFACEFAAGNLEMAAHLAFNTNQTRAEAIATLERAPKHAQGGGLDGAMAPYAGRGPGQDASREQQGKAATASAWDKVLKATAPRRR